VSGRAATAGQINCAIWKNEIRVGGSTKTVLKASVERRCRGKNGTWKSTTSFSRNEIPLAVYCLSRTFETIAGVEQVQNGNGVAEDVVSE